MNEQNDDELHPRFDHAMRRLLTTFENIRTAPHSPHARRAEIHTAISAAWSSEGPPSADELDPDEYIQSNLRKQEADERPPWSAHRPAVKNDERPSHDSS